MGFGLNFDAAAGSVEVKRPRFHFYVISSLPSIVCSVTCFKAYAVKDTACSAISSSSSMLE